MENKKIFDPEFSEFNPVCAELEAIKDKVCKEEKTGFFTNLFVKFFFYKIMAQLD